jgi:hypothetical protein
LAEEALSEEDHPTLKGPAEPDSPYRFTAVTTYRTDSQGQFWVSMVTSPSVYEVLLVMAILS